MTQSLADNRDLEAFTEHMGLTGIDADLFYEIYYDIVWEENDTEIREAWRSPFFLLYLLCH